MNVTTLAEWEAWAEAGADAQGRPYTKLPFIRRHPSEGKLPLSWLYAWQEALPESFVLESGRTGRYTYLGRQAASVIRGTGREASVSAPLGSSGSDPAAGCELGGAPLELVKRWLEPHAAPRPQGAGLPPFLGGCVGYWGYDIVRSLEKLPTVAARNEGIPDYAFLLVDELYIVDRETGDLYIVVHKGLRNGETVPTLYSEAEQRAEQMYAEWCVFRDRAARDETIVRQRERIEQAVRDRNLDIDLEQLRGLERSFDKESFMRAVERIQAYISAGDVFQVNLSTRQTTPHLGVTAEQIYETLRIVNPSPYMGLLRLGDVKLVSGSPELLVQLHGRKLRTRPIAGTRPRSANEADDAKLSEELLLSEKERAEHIMLVDLERNDLGRISTYGTVKVDELMAIERYSHVMHIVSEVTGELADGNDAFDVIAATFPGGTITGAPKVRTMEIIEELEPVRRGPYTGALGWIDYGGNLEFNILIRTLVVNGQVGWVQAGAGIVIDSVPDKEYAESLNKAKALWKAIQLTEEQANDTRDR
ncbi:anthranilate synthase component I family protein [Paenibacillus chartarius]|uniref:Anthranilate synthase component I family protein n=1 Tax=Paenibacillus chartarius TaxID=747481 RepID=A0ABV6DTW2_9BACL